MFQFYCPQGHVLQGEPSQVGQLIQCPMCGASFLIPPPDMGPASQGGFFPPPGTWQAAGPAFPSYPAQGGMPGMMPPPNMSPMPGSPMPAGPMSVGGYPAPQGQPFGFGPMPVQPQPAIPQPAAPAAPPADTPEEPAADDRHEEAAEASRFNLGFDPQAREALPFDIPGQGDTEPAPFAAPPLPPPSFAAPAPAADFQPVAGVQDFLKSAPAAVESPAAVEAPTPQSPPKTLHIRCPSGHLVKAKSDLLGKTGRCPACKKTFELRYEDSVEFQRRKENILRREEVKSGRAWLAWAFLAAFGLLVMLVALMLLMSR